MGAHGSHRGFEMTHARAITLDELIAQLTELKLAEVVPGNTPVLLSQDAEGNQYHWIDGYSIGFFDADPHWSDPGEPVLSTADVAGYGIDPNTPEEIERAIKVVCIWPV